MSNSSLHTQVWYVLMGDHSFTCHPHVYPQVEWTIPAFTPHPHSITALWLVFISCPAKGRRLSWPGQVWMIDRLTARVGWVGWGSVATGYWVCKWTGRTLTTAVIMEIVPQTLTRVLWYYCLWSSSSTSPGTKCLKVEEMATIHRTHTYTQIYKAHDSQE